MFPNNWQISQAVREFAQVSSASVPQLRLIPFGHLQPEFAEWWLVPGLHPSNPAYRHGKVFFRRVASGPEGGPLYAGLYVEKGFDTIAGTVPGVAKKHVMQGDWLWHTFMPAVGRGECDAAIQAVAEGSGLPVVVSVGVGEMNRPPDDVEIKHGDEVWFKTGSHGRLEVTWPAREALRGLNGCESLRDIAAAIAGSDLRFSWLGFRAGVRLHYNHGAASAWDAASIWQRALAPWTAWLK